MIRSPRRRLAVEVQLQNRLENAYNTSLKLHYSRNLHFSSISIKVHSTFTVLHMQRGLSAIFIAIIFPLIWTKENANFKIECTSLGSNSHSCNVSYPVFRSHSKVTCCWGSWSLHTSLPFKWDASLQQSLLLFVSRWILCWSLNSAAPLCTIGYKWSSMLPGKLVRTFQIPKNKQKRTTFLVISIFFCLTVTAVREKELWGTTVFSCRLSYNMSQISLLAGLSVELT